jgi:hypothetical protein
MILYTQTYTTTSPRAVHHKPYKPETKPEIQAMNETSVVKSATA